MNFFIWFGFLAVCFGFTHGYEGDCGRCDPNAHCEVDKCVCLEGFKGNGTTCAKEMCSENTSCPADSRCVNETCVKQETMCKHCPQLSSCENVDKDCRCKSGFVLDGTSCLRKQAVAGVMKRQSQDNVAMHMPNSSLLIVEGVPSTSAGRTTSIDELVSSNNIVKSGEVARKSKLSKSISGKGTLPTLQSVVKTHSVKSKSLLLKQKENRTYPFSTRSLFDYDPFQTLGTNIKVDPLDHYPKIPLEFPGQDPSLPCLSSGPIEVVKENANDDNPEIPNLLPLNPENVLVDNHVIDFRGEGGNQIVDRNEAHSTTGDVPPDGNTYQLPSQTFNYPKQPKAKPPSPPAAKAPITSGCEAGHPASPPHPPPQNIQPAPPPPQPPQNVHPAPPPPPPPQNHLQVQIVYPNPKKPIPPQIVPLTPPVAETNQAAPAPAPLPPKAGDATLKPPPSSQNDHPPPKNPLLNRLPQT